MHASTRLLLPLSALVLMAAGCAKDLYKAGDVLVEKDNGVVLGKVLEVGRHTFDSGVTDVAVLVQLDRDPNRKEWYSAAVLPGNFKVEGQP